MRYVCDRYKKIVETVQEGRHGDPCPERCGGKVFCPYCGKASKAFTENCTSDKEE